VTARGFAVGVEVGVGLIRKVFIETKRLGIKSLASGWVSE